MPKRSNIVRAPDFKANMKEISEEGLDDGVRDFEKALAAGGRDLPMRPAGKDHYVHNADNPKMGRKGLGRYAILLHREDGDGNDADDITLIDIWISTSDLADSD